MKRLTATQWFAFILAAAGIVIAQLDQYGVSAQVIGIASSSLGTLKLLYDLYMSFQAQNVADFANNVNTGEARGKRLVSKADVKAWADL